MRAVPAPQFQDGFHRNLRETPEALFKEIRFSGNIPKGKGYFVILRVVIYLRQVLISCIIMSTYCSQFGSLAVKGCSIALPHETAVS
jgi:hypothetical protein